MTFPDLLAHIPDLSDGIAGRLTSNFKLTSATWFRVGGPAQLFFQPDDEADLARFLKKLPEDIPVQMLGLGSNMLVRDGGIEGVVIRLGRKFATLETDGALRLRAGAAVPDQKLAKVAADNGIAGFSFYRGIPGVIGGALRMNAGANGGETKDHLLEVRAVNRQGEVVSLSNTEMGYSYRHSSAPDDLIFTSALYEGTAGDPVALKAEVEEVARYREEKQPTRERTGGSTFKNPDGHSAWKLVDEAGCRGLRIGGAQVSEKHCNFLLNVENATGYELELLGETVRKRVVETSGVRLEWEIKRLGTFADGQTVAPFLGEA